MWKPRSNPVLLLLLPKSLAKGVAHQLCQTFAVQFWSIASLMAHMVTTLFFVFYSLIFHNS